MNIIFSTIIAIVILLLFTIFAAWIGKFNAAFSQNGTFKRVGDAAVASDAPASPDASGGTSGGGQNPPEVEG